MKCRQLSEETMVLLCRWYLMCRFDIISQTYTYSCYLQLTVHRAFFFFSFHLMFSRSWSHFPSLSLFHFFLWDAHVEQPIILLRRLLKHHYIILTTAQQLVWHQQWKCRFLVEIILPFELSIFSFRAVNSSIVTYHGTCSSISDRKMSTSLPGTK